MNLSTLIWNNMHSSFQNLQWLSAPLCLNLTSKYGSHAWLALTNYFYLTYNLPADYDEVVVAEWWRFKITRPETEAERTDREDSEAEDEYLEREKNRYTEWYY